MKSGLGGMLISWIAMELNHVQDFYFTGLLKLLIVQFPDNGKTMYQLCPKNPVAGDFLFSR